MIKERIDQLPFQHFQTERENVMRFLTSGFFMYHLVVDTGGKFTAGVVDTPVGKNCRRCHYNQCKSRKWYHHRCR